MSFGMEHLSIYPYDCNQITVIVPIKAILNEESVILMF